MKYTKVAEDAFSKLQLNAGVIVDNFTPATGVIGNIIGATSGGVNFTATPTYSDFGEDVDNAPTNVKEMKVLDSVEVTMSGTYVTVSASSAKGLVGAGDIDGEDATHIIPRNDLKDDDFQDIWWVGDYSDVNTGESAGFIAIHVINALNTGGFQIQSTNKGKGQFAFTYTGHYSMADPDTVPYEIYVKAGSSASDDDDDDEEDQTPAG